MKSLRAAAAAALLASLAAHGAEFEIRSPMVEARELDATVKLAGSRDADASFSGGRSALLEIEYGVNDWWAPAIEGEWGRDPGPGQAFAFEASAFESRLRLTPKDAFIDVGVFVELEHARGGAPGTFRAGPVVHKDIGPTSTLLNLFAVREHGAQARAGTSVMYAWQTRWLLSERLQPGVELFGGALDAGVGTRHQRLAGPVLFGAFDVAKHQDLRYEVGYLHALDSATPRGTMKILLSYEYVLP